MNEFRMIMQDLLPYIGGFFIIAFLLRVIIEIPPIGRKVDEWAENDTKKAMKKVHEHYRQ